MVTTGQQAILHPQDRAKGGESLLRPPAPVRPLPVVILTTFFPNRREPHRTVFLRNLVTAMRPGCDIAVVAPIPRRPPIGRWRERAAFPSTDRLGDLALHHPRFLSLPGLSWLAGLSYAWGVWPVLRDLKQARGWFVVHIHCAYPDAVGGALAARLLGLPWVVTVHGSDINIAARKPALRPQIRWALRGAQRVVAVSRALQEKILALGGLQPERVECIPCSGYDPDVFKPRSRAALRVGLGLARDARMVAFVGNLVPVKGVDVLLRAWAVLKASRSSETLGVQDRLVLIGNGAQRGRLEQLAASLGIASAVAFLGAVTQQVVSDWIGAADLLCLPSHCEGSPNVVVESLASGVPVVASRVGGVPDLVTQGVSGYLVPPGDPAALAQALGAAFETAWNADAISASVAHLDWRRLAQRNIELLATIQATA